MLICVVTTHHESTAPKLVDQAGHEAPLALVELHDARPEGPLRRHV
jgi:CO dehydrogenase/acetyl-CoA synthase delta subunit